ncbi:MAG: RNA polymerase-associated protein RapA [Myxococcota bacterium]|nr:RNA polymerase-associated protein RapA [Myxococcota bacterium]
MPQPLMITVRNGPVFDLKPRAQAVETPVFHRRLMAARLSLRAEGAHGLADPLAPAGIDLNPHQVEAAAFALDALPRGGCILADEVGLGKTIEAGLVLAQLRCDGKNRALVIAPASVRKQWASELQEKFGVPSSLPGGGNDAFSLEEGPVHIVSYAWAYRRAHQIESMPFDVVIIDEAHRLRNAAQKGARMASAIAGALRGKPKVLLTATPLQNSLNELFGLVSIIDEKLLGTPWSFRERFFGDPQGLTIRGENDLRERIQPVLRRTLRAQVEGMIQFTRRRCLTADFQPGPDETALYDDVTAFLARERLACLNASQRPLMTMVLRKLLASSSFAVAAALRRLCISLEGMMAEEAARVAALRDQGAFFDEAELEDLGLEAEFDGGEGASAAEEPMTWDEMAEERELLHELAGRAALITSNAKGDALLAVLGKAMREAERCLNNPRLAPKAVIFTESRHTQRYLVELLEANGYADLVTPFSGTNTGPHAMRAYRAWVDSLDPAEWEKVKTLSRDQLMRAALLHEFRCRSRILVATEAAAEGLNLQFCNLVINYDLPWNPQRIEQRVGRCHRYGQQHDVVVLNLLNSGNEADARVYDLLSHKFQLFEGAFGASDEVLGQLGSGAGFERRVFDILNQCRGQDQIRSAFEQLTRELDEMIGRRMQEAGALLSERFDGEVRDRLRAKRRQLSEALDARAAQVRDYVLAEAGHSNLAELVHGRQYRLDGLPGEIAALNGAPPRGRIIHFHRGDAASGASEFLHARHPWVEAMLHHRLTPEARWRELRLHLTSNGSAPVYQRLSPCRGLPGLWFAAIFSTGASGEKRLFQHASVFMNGAFRALDAQELQLIERLGASNGEDTPLDPAACEAALQGELRREQAAFEAWVRERREERVRQEESRLEQYFLDRSLEGEKTLERLRRGLEENRRKRDGLKDPARINELRAGYRLLEDQYRRELRLFLESSMLAVDEKQAETAALRSLLDFETSHLVVARARFVME